MPNADCKGCFEKAESFELEYMGTPASGHAYSKQFGSAEELIAAAGDGTITYAFARYGGVIGERYFDGTVPLDLGTAKESTPDEINRFIHKYIAAKLSSFLHNDSCRIH